MTKDDQGITLIELIVVLMIISVLAGGTIIGIRSLDSENTRSTTQRINALLDYVRILNMSKDNEYYLVIKKNSESFEADVIYIDQTTHSEVVVQTEKLKLKDSGDIRYTNSLNTDFSIAAGKELRLGYTKDSGSLTVDPDDGTIKCIIINGGGRSFTIRLVTATGKHYIE